MNTRVLVAPLVVATALIAAACERQQSTTAAPVPVAVTASQFQQLRWIEGVWRGSGGGYDGFYERYRWTDDSTITKYEYADSTLVQVSDSGMITLRDGAVRSASPRSSYVAITLDSTSVTFAPERGASNGFEWRHTGPGAWTARITWDSAGVPRERLYEMRAITTPR
jgi:uncharacterized lipoprotein YbaY